MGPQLQKPTLASKSIRKFVLRLQRTITIVLLAAVGYDSNRVVAPADAIGIVSHIASCNLGCGVSLCAWKGPRTCEYFPT